MPLKEICNTSYNLKVTNTIPGIATPNGSESVTKSLKNKADGKEVIVSKVGWSPSGCTLTAYTFVSGSSAGVSATALKCKAEKKAPVRKGDVGVCAGGFTLTASPFTPLPCACTLEIDDAGQTKVKGA